MVEAWLAALAAGYFIGSIPVGLWVGRYVRGIDLRAGGSGKIGTTNVLRRLGVRWSIPVLAADVAKGIVPVLIVRAAFDSPTADVLAAMAALIGHIYPLYAGFRGGRAAASGIGALFILTAPAAGIAVAVAVILLALTRIMSLSVLAGMTIAGLSQGLIVVTTNDPDAYLGFAVAGWLLIAFAHRDNIARLLAGTERVLGQNAPSGPDPVADPAGD